MAVTAITAVDPEYDPFLNPGDNKLFVIEGVNAAYQCRAGTGSGALYGTVAEAETDPALVASRIRALESNYLTLRRAATTAAGGSAQGWRYVGCLNPPYRTDLNIPTTAEFAEECRAIQVQELLLRGAATQTLYDGMVDMTQTTGWRLYSEVQPTYNKLYNADGTHFTDFGYQYFATLMYWWLTVGTGFYPGAVPPSAAQIAEIIASSLTNQLSAIGDKVTTSTSYDLTNAAYTAVTSAGESARIQARNKIPVEMVVAESLPAVTVQGELIDESVDYRASISGSPTGIVYLKSASAATARAVVLH